MTTVGHSLTGLSLAVLIVPRFRTWRRFAVIGAIYAFAANVPDLPIPGWGHGAYAVSHSVFIPLALLLLSALSIFTGQLRVPTTRCIITGCLLAWLSHMILDSTYAHGNGLAVFWPFSEAHLALPLAWFETLSPPVFSEHNRDVLIMESKVFGFVLLIAAAARLARNAARRGWSA